MRNICSMIVTVLWKMIKFVLNVVLGAAKLCLEILKLGLLLFGIIAKLFLSFVRMGTF